MKPAYRYRNCLPVQRLNSRIPSTRTILARRQLLNLLLGQLKIKNFRILLDPARRNTLHQRNKPLLQTPPQQDLRLRLAILVRHGANLGIAKALAAHNRAVRLDGDVARATPLHDVIARQPGVNLPLADGQDAAFTAAALGLELLDVGLELVEVVHAVVGDADGADLAGVDALDEGLPRALAVLGAAVGGVDEDQVEVRQLRLLQGDVDEVERVLVPEGFLTDGDLGGEEDFVAGDAGGGDAGCGGALIAVC